MTKFRAATATAAMVTMLASSGCFRSTKLVRRTQAPDVYKSATVEELEKQVCQRDQSIKTLRANVLLTVHTGGGRTGKVENYTSLKGYLFLEKPDDLRVILQLPLLGSRALDMVSTGGRFTLVYDIPGKGESWKTGSNTISEPSTNPLENLRPPVFFDSLLTPCVPAEQYVSLNESTRILPAPDKKRVDIEEPDYDLQVEKSKSGHVLSQVRTIHFSRVTMLPFEQEIYDDKGVATLATYDKYQKFGGVEFPTVITMERPRDELKLKIEITKMTLNEPFESDQFVLTPPTDAKVQELK